MISETLDKNINFHQKFLRIFRRDFFCRKDDFRSENDYTSPVGFATLLDKRLKRRLDSQGKYPFSNKSKAFSEKESPSFHNLKTPSITKKRQNLHFFGVAQNSEKTARLPRKTTIQIFGITKKGQNLHFFGVVFSRRRDFRNIQQPQKAFSQRKSPSRK